MGSVPQTIARCDKELEEMIRYLEWMEETGNITEESLARVKIRQAQIGQEIRQGIARVEKLLQTLEIIWQLVSLLEKYR